MAGFFTKNRGLFRLVVVAFLAGPFSLSAKGQAVQPQTGSSTQSQTPQPQTGSSAQPQQPQAQQGASDQKPKQQEQAKPKPQTQQKKIKAHVVKADQKKKKAETDTSQSAEPDKVLYQRAMLDIKKGKYTEGRLTLQALINTYPDSEYLAKAKLGVADSYYREGGTSNLTQAIEEYKNFIIFFPFLDDAAYAQMQIGLGHFRMMEKSDRDITQAQEAEQEFQTFLLKYPQSPLVPKAEQDLRNIQEVLADGEYRIARFYFLKQDYPASAARLIEVAERYPLYSQSDETLWMLGAVYARAKQASRNEDDKNHWADLAGKCYERIVRDYPLSHLAPAAKARLKSMGMAVPESDPTAVARMKQEQLYQKGHHQTAFLRLPMTMLKSEPPVAQAAHSGLPTLNPPNDAVSARDVLQQGAKGPDFELVNKPEGDTTQTPADEGGVREAVPSSSNGQAPQGPGIGVQIITPPADPNSQPASSQAPPSNANPPATNAPAASAPADAVPATPPVNPPPTTTTGAPQTPSAPPSSTPAAVQGGSATPSPVQGGAASPNSTAPQTGSSGQQSGQANGQASSDGKGQPQASDKPTKADKADPSAESSSKKKKGIKKIIMPW